VFLALLLTGVLVVNHELIIPPLADKLVRHQGDIPGQESYDIWFIPDGNGSLICSARFDVETSTLQEPTIIIRRKIANSRIWEVIGRIDAERAVYNSDTSKWDLTNGRLTNGRLIEKGSIKGPQPISSYASDITPKDIPVRLKSEHTTLLSWRQLAALRQLYSQKHFRVTEPIINLAMLMVCLPILVCRDPKSMKSAVAISFALVGACFVTTFICKMLAPEANVDSFYQIGFYAWLPVFIFLPIAFIELDSMKT
jgi:hypothetical protein